MRSDKEIAQEALRLAGILRRKRANKKQRVYAACLLAACLALVAGLSFVLPAVNTNVAMPDGAYSATLFADGAASGYVLMGVLSFALGVAVTVFCFRKAKKG